MSLAEEDEEDDAAGEGRPRRAPRPTTVVVLPDGLGEIRYNSEQKNFVAICRNRAHAAASEAECKKTRTSNPASRSLTNPHQGRPLGLLVGWLRCGHQHATGANHKAAISPLCTNRVERDASRRWFYEHCSGARDISRFEREKHEDEGSEPEIIK